MLELAFSSDTGIVDALFVISKFKLELFSSFDFVLILCPAVVLVTDRILNTSHLLLLYGLNSADTALLQASEREELVLQMTTLIFHSTTLTQDS